MLNREFKHPTNFLNLSVTPVIWKIGRIILILKPGQSADQGRLYSPNYIPLQPPGIELPGQRLYFPSHRVQTERIRTSIIFLEIPTESL